MSGRDPHAGLMSAFVAPFADEAAAQSRRTPHAQRQSRAGYGAALLSWCWITLDVCGPQTSASPALLYAWWGGAALGVYWLLAGFLGSARGPLVGGLTLLAEATGASWLLWDRMYPFDMPLAAFLLHGIYLSILCSALAQPLAALIPLPGDAERTVRENMAAKNPPIIPVHRAR
jgi:hypothetical protein